MELLDVIDKKGNSLGYTKDRYEPFEGEEFCRAVHVFLRTDRGQYLLQKRSAKKKIRPGVWDVTGGMVDAGEESKEACLREVQEELSLSLEEKNLEYMGSCTGDHLIMDLWWSSLEFDARDIRLQEEEVEAVLLLEPEAFLKQIRSLRHRTKEYKRLAESFIREKENLK